MVTKRIIDVDTADRADGKVPAWDTASGTHIYVPAGSVADITDIPVAETDTSLVFAPDGAGNGEWVAPDLSGKELNYVEFTAPVNITATSSATSNVIVTAGSVTFDGAAIRVEFGASSYEIPSGNSLLIVLWDDTAGAALGILCQMTSAGGVERNAGLLVRRFTPAAGARVLSIRGYVGSAATGVIGAGAGGAGVLMPGFVRIVKV